MGIREGITMIVGGGFHGKSTLLQALQVGVYNKVRARSAGVAPAVRAQPHSVCCKVGTDSFFLNPAVTRSALSRALVKHLSILCKEAP